jgi:hypothetical protein
MKPQPEIGGTQLSIEENTLAELECQKRTVETADHRGFGNAIRLIQLRAEMEALEDNIRARQATSQRQSGRMRIVIPMALAEFSSERLCLNSEITKECPLRTKNERHCSADLLAQSMSASACSQQLTT